MHEMAVCIAGNKTNRIFRTNASLAKRRFNTGFCYTLQKTRHFVQTEQPLQVSNIILNCMKKQVPETEACIPIQICNYDL